MCKDPYTFRVPYTMSVRISTPLVYGYVHGRVLLHVYGWYTDMYWMHQSVLMVYWLIRCACVMTVYRCVLTASILMVNWRILTASGVLRVYWAVLFIVYWRFTNVYWCILMCTDDILTSYDCFRCTEGILKCTVHCVLIVYWCVLTGGVLMVYRSVLLMCADSILMCTDSKCTDGVLTYTDCLQVDWGDTEVYCLLCTDCILMCTESKCTDGTLTYLNWLTALTYIEGLLKCTVCWCTGCKSRVVYCARLFEGELNLTQG